MTVVSAIRLGQQPAGKGLPRKLLVKLGSQVQAVKVLTSARRLSRLNIERKANSERPIGIDWNLSPAKLQHRTSVLAAFKEGQSRESGTKGVPLEAGNCLYAD